MIEPLLRRFLDHPRRGQIVIILTSLTGLVIVWPAVDVYNAAKARTTEALSLTRAAQQEIDRLPFFAEVHAKKQAQLASLEKRMVTERAAQDLQHELTELGRRTGCTVRRARLGDPAIRDWKAEDHPVIGTRLANSRADTPFRLETRQLTLSVTGPMTGLYRFLDELSRVEKVIHSRSAMIKRSDDDGTTAALEMDVLLFDLTRRSQES